MAVNDPYLYYYWDPQDVPGSICDCAGCGSEAPLKRFEVGLADKPAYFCEFCANSSLGSMAEYPRQYTEEVRELAKLVAISHNMLLDKLDPVRAFRFDNAVKVPEDYFDK